MCMVTKTLTITETAYNLLTGCKLTQESFSEEIVRILSTRKPKKLADYFGILSEKEGNDILKALEHKRAINRKLLAKRVEEWS